MRYARYLLILTIGFTLNASGETNGTPIDEAAIRTAVAQANADWKTTFLAEDLAITGVYANDVIVMPYGRPIVQGQTELNAYYADTYSSLQINDYTDTVLSSDVCSADTVIEITKYVLDAEDNDGGNGFIENGKLLIVWKKQADDSWRIHREIFNPTGAGNPETRGPDISPTAGSFDEAAILTAIHDNAAMWATNFLAEDSAVTSLYADDVIIAPHKAGFVEGRTELNVYYADLFKTLQINDYSDTEVSVDVCSADTAIQTATYRLDAEDEGGGNEFVENGKFVLVYKKQSDDSWLIQREIFNPDM